MKPYRIEFNYARCVGECKKGKGKPPDIFLTRVFRKKQPKILQNNFILSSYGGSCIARVFNRDALMGVGTSTCSLADRFIYKVGRKLTAQRALDQAIRGQPDEEFRQWCIQQKILLSKTPG
jgi:hypothetical protein